MLRFLDPRHAGNSEIVGVGGRLDVPTLLMAYRRGAFPWPMDGMPLCWFSPPQRAVLDFSRLHVPHRLARLRRHSPYTFTLDTAFEQVITACQSVPRSGQSGTWITPAVMRGYGDLHRAGFAHSAEAWDAEGNLVGGLYGVGIDGAFAGESMFHVQPNASKLSLLFLIDHLQARGLTWMDIQMPSPHMEALGAYVIPRDDFLDRLDDARIRNISPFG